MTVRLIGVRMCQGWALIAFVLGIYLGQML